MNSPICKLTVSAFRHWIYMKESIWRMIMRCMHSPSLFSWSILDQNCCFFCHNLQMIRLESLKLSILALKYRKPIKKNLCELVIILQAAELTNWKLGDFLAQGHICKSWKQWYIHDLAELLNIPQKFLS